MEGQPKRRTRPDLANDVHVWGTSGRCWITNHSARFGQTRVPISARLGRVRQTFADFDPWLEDFAPILTEFNRLWIDFGQSWTDFGQTFAEIASTLVELGQIRPQILASSGQLLPTSSRFCPRSPEFGRTRSGPEFDRNGRLQSMVFQFLPSIGREVTPYEERYGMHPSLFDFDADGNMVTAHSPTWPPSPREGGPESPSCDDLDDAIAPASGGSVGDVGGHAGGGAL